MTEGLNCCFAIALKLRLLEQSRLFLVRFSVSIFKNTLHIWSLAKARLFVFCTSLIGRRRSGVMRSAERYFGGDPLAYFLLFSPLVVLLYAVGLEKDKICSKSRVPSIDRGLELLFCNSSQASFTPAVSFISCSVFCEYFYGYSSYMESRISEAFLFF